MPDAAERLIDHSLQLRWDEIPASCRQFAATFLHDSVAVGVAAVDAPSLKPILTTVPAWGRSENANHRLGAGLVPISAPAAAYVNAFQIHCQEYDAVHEQAVVHPMATIVAALLAEAGRSVPVSGQDFIAGMIAGVDVAVTLGLAARSPLRFFRPATAGVFGCVAGLARMRRLERETALNAFGLALAFAAGTMQSHVEGLPVLPLQIAQAARSAVEAVDLARAGMPGPRGTIDGPFGYAALFEETMDLEAAFDAIDRRDHHILGVSWKPFPSGRASHGGIVATQRLMSAQGLSSATLNKLVYHAPPLVARLVGRPARAGMAPSYARLCLPYLAAVTLIRSTVGLSDFNEASLNDRQILELASRISVEANDNPDPAAFVPALAIATLRDETRLEHKVEAQLGSPTYPLTPDQHLAKAADALTFGGLGDAVCLLKHWIQDVERQADIAGSLSAVLRPQIH